MSLINRRRALMTQKKDDNLFDIGNIKMCATASYAKSYYPTAENKVIWNGGIYGHSPGGIIYIKPKGIKKVTFSADVQFAKESATNFNNLSFVGFNDINEQDIVLGGATSLYQRTISPSTSFITFSVVVSGYKYIGFQFWSQEKHIMGFSNVKILEVV